ncbi:LPXTG cell wall anchor domain-containing protein [Staphylococcus pasteuri]|uniref:LPXTG cell wall anchor domain-containing protein n=1 Tax=Staphylococcus pasteuri TaxID=45972 RepID=UPI000E6A46BD|nr:LPXTG cell wall anchor domain-containing protein [Staphylococcus pasteuri]MCT1926691.1 LPXTG cell wall anchor domain-containing protein [Staphylococcus pasteuri]QQT10437.1 LPXTG cell wall anchor domain-containing protein [Staphylococcus pasteuri]RIO52460.1 LPXTG cell wall anchor domain-containing protein [Staphylococcus pasteuri]
MKKLTILGATTLAGTLLFTGVNTHDANASEYQLNGNNVQSIATSVWQNNGGNPDRVKFDKTQDKGDYYLLNYHNASNVGGGAIRVYKDGTVENGSGLLASNDDSDAEFYKLGKYDFDNSKSNDQQQATDNTVNTQQNDQQTQATNRNDATQSNTPEQSQAKALPETGQSNTTFVTTVAAILLAVGSLLTFKRVSKNQ